MQVLDEGRLTDNKGRTANFKNTIIILTSNLGSQYLASLGEDENPTNVEAQVMEVVRAHFRPEFLNRLDDVLLTRAFTGLETNMLRPSIAAAGLDPDNLPVRGGIDISKDINARIQTVLDHSQYIMGPEVAELEQRLAACVNILPGMTSIYRWEGALARDAEAVMIVKTRAAVADAVIEAVKSRHSYTNPALLNAIGKRAGVTKRQRTTGSEQYRRH